MARHIAEADFAKGINELAQLIQVSTTSSLHAELLSHQEPSDAPVGVSLSQPWKRNTALPSEKSTKRIEEQDASTAVVENPDLDLDLESGSDPERLDIPHQTRSHAPGKHTLSPSAAILTGTAVYDVFYSATYRVPTLYIRLLDDAGSALPPRLANAFLEDLLPGIMQAAVRAVGVLGGVTLTDHPIAGLAYFVHPCRTAEAIGQIVAERPLSGCEYLVVWLGIIGSAVGLSLPLEVARSISRPRHPDAGHDELQN